MKDYWQITALRLRVEAKVVPVPGSHFFYINTVYVRNWIFVSNNYHLKI